MTVTPLWKKLALRPGETLLLIDAPEHWGAGELPDGARTMTEGGGERAGAQPDTIIAFLRTLTQVRRAIPELAPRIFPDGAIWAAWPRRAGGHDSDITDGEIRAVALALGLVDVKVAALDDDWSGLRLVWRRERRQTAGAAPG